jgi:hypothetical protein
MDGCFSSFWQWHLILIILSLFLRQWQDFGNIPKEPTVPISSYVTFATVGLIYSVLIILREESGLFSGLFLLALRPYYPWKYIRCRCPLGFYFEIFFSGEIPKISFSFVGIMSVRLTKMKDYYF